MIREFKEFISRGNVLDLAVGVIIGGAFGKIVSSLVNDLIMPFISIILGKTNFSDLYLKVNDTKVMYGTFLQNVFDFLIIAFVIFMLVKFVNKLKRKEVKKEELATKSNEVLLLEEIRDLLKKTS